MLYYPIHSLRKAGIDDILIVTGREHMGDVVSLMGSGREWCAHFTYKVQDEAGGIAEALGLAEDFCKGEPMVVVLGDNVFNDDLYPYVKAFENQEAGARVLLKEVPDPSRFGVPEFDGGRIIRIAEKPAQPKSDYCVTGIYMYPSDVFSVIKTLKPSGRGELEITDVNNHYISQGTLEWNVLEGWWTDAGTFESLQLANVLTQSTDLDLSPSVVASGL